MKSFGPIQLMVGILLLFATASCRTVLEVTGVEKPVSISRLQFLNSFEIPYNKTYRGTKVGGLSGIDYDVKRHVYYLISDDRSDYNPVRFYTAKIRINHNQIDTLQFTDVTTLLQPNGKTYPNAKTDPYHTPDPEALRYNLRIDQLIWSSEGERIVSKNFVLLEDPAIIAATRNGKYVDSFPLPVQMHMHQSETGLRKNGTFEGLTFANAFKTLYVNIEEPLYEDGPRAGLADSSAWIRIIKYDVATHTPVAQLAYKIEPVAHPAVPANAFKINGVPDILAAGNDQLLVTERSFSTGKPNCTIRVFLANLKDAEDVSDLSSLEKNPPARPVSKKLLLNMDSLGIYIDNIEGATFGPKLANGHQTLLFVSDNNFSAAEKTQFLLFEVIP